MAPNTRLKKGSVALRLRKKERTGRPKPEKIRPKKPLHKSGEEKRKKKKGKSTGTDGTIPQNAKKGAPIPPFSYEKEGKKEEKPGRPETPEKRSDAKGKGLSYHQLRKKEKKEKSHTPERGKRPHRPGFSPRKGGTQSVPHLGSRKESEGSAW